MSNPMINIVGSNHVTVDPVQTIEDVVAVVDKFAKLADADYAGAMVNLFAQVGDLASAHADGSIEDAEHLQGCIADVIISTLVIGSLYGVGAATLAEAICGRLANQATDAINGLVHEAMTSRGFQAREI